MNREDWAVIEGWIAAVLASLAQLPLKSMAELGGMAAPAAAGGAAHAKR